MASERQVPGPYVGLRPFQASESELFFGRSREIRQIVNLIYANPVLLLYSQSGAGKTSLLRAGVIPRLREDGFEVVWPGRVEGFVPQHIETEGIRNIFVFSYLLSSLETNASPATLVRTTLAEYLRELEHPHDEVGQPSPRVLIFDQFEELFVGHQDRWKDRQDFFEQIRQALDGDHLLRVVFALREEYVGELERYAHLLPDALSARFHLGRLREADALRAVVAPLGKRGQRFAEGVAEKVVSDLMMIRVQNAEGGYREVPGEFIEPVLLQVVMASLWASLPPDEKVIGEHYLAEWGSSDAVLSRFYDRVINEVVARSPEISMETLRNWFEESLITPMGTRSTVVRGERETARLPNRVIDELEDHYLIRAEYRAGLRWYELTHDRLIRPIQESNGRFFQQSRYRASVS